VVTQQAGSVVQFRDTWPDHPDRRARLVATERTRVEGVTALPGYVALESDRPLVLITPATAKTINSIFGETDPPIAAVHLHPDDAAARHLVDGQDVRVTDGASDVFVIVKVDADLRPGVASMPKGLWRASVGGGFTANAFAPDTLNDLAGGACFNDARVDVFPISS
jgi:anaerobic selenocysteine-containing dehydrogenase